MKISINGKVHNIETSSSITQALEVSNSLLGKKNDDFVIALNQIFVPRSQYSTTQLQDNDALELLSPMAGG